MYFMDWWGGEHLDYNRFLDDENVLLVYNDFGKVLRLPPCRVITMYNGRIDCIAGTFVLMYSPIEDGDVFMRDFPEDLAQKYIKMFEKNYP